MTTYPVADQRPPPRRPPDPGRPPSRPSIGNAVPPSRPSTGNAVPPLDRPPSTHRDHSRPSVDDRPAKRRKVSNAAIPTASPTSASLPGAALASPVVPDHTPTGLRIIKPAVPCTSPLTRRPKVESTEPGRDGAPDLPSRPWNAAQQHKPAAGTEPSHRSRVPLPVPNTPDALETPFAVPRLVAARPAGFFPWTGRHPEDVLSDVNVKQGYSDKAPTPTEKELNTARVPLYNAFKHEGGVDSLSALFALVLDQKNLHGRITGASTFKPPPRVTLTEAKRKSWIADLANAQVPLRRLSRTIPQGIRGQLLLDQCLQNDVPLSRAIWFAKCVGANEIRTLKRKGTTPAVAAGTEGKWLREWTVNVEQYLESHLELLAADDWIPTYLYLLRLATRLYWENLLDRDHYLDWVVHAFAAADLGHAPFWLMVVQIYQRDLACYRRKATKLAESLIDKLHALEQTSTPIDHDFHQKLQAATRALLLSRPVTFLLPDGWPEVVDTIRGLLDLDDARESRIFHRLYARNRRAMGCNRARYFAKPPRDQAVVSILDDVRIPLDLQDLERRLAAASPDQQFLMATCLQWSCSRFRRGKARIYVFARLARRWQLAGHDVDSVLLNYMSACKDATNAVDVDAVRQLIAQLSRSKTFPLSKYVQWLMVRGLPKKGSVAIADDPASTDVPVADRPESNSSADHFLLDVCLHNVEEPVENLRNALLRRTGFDLQKEEAAFGHYVGLIQRELHLADSTLIDARDFQRLGSLPWTIKSRIAMWIRSTVVERRDADDLGSVQSNPLMASHGISCEKFAIMREILELLGDEAVLADVVGILSPTRDDDLLGCLVATLHFHAETFSAIGAFDVLRQRMCQRYMSWRTTRPTMPLLTAALLDLCAAYPVAVPSLKLLQQDLVRGDRGRAVAACSPYSDGIAESLQQAGATFVEDFEAILQSEPNMTDQTMNGLFAVLVDRIEKHLSADDDDSQTVWSFCQLLSRLRLCRKSQGDFLIQRWVARLISLLDVDPTATVLADLIGSGCLTFKGLLAAVPNFRLQEGSGVAKLVHTVSVSPAHGATRPAIYQTRTRWREYAKEQPENALEILLGAGLEDQAPSLEADLLSYLVNFPSSTLSEASTPIDTWMLAALNRVLRCDGDDSEGTVLRSLLQSIDVLSRPYVESRLRYTSGADPWLDTKEQGDAVDMLSDTLDQILHNSAGAAGHSVHVAQLVQATVPSIANRLRHKVEAAFLDALPRLPATKVGGLSSALSATTLRTLSSILEQAYQLCTTSTTQTPGFTIQLIDKLTQYLKMLTSLAPSTSNTSALGVAGVSSPTTSTNLAPGPTGSENTGPLGSASAPGAIPSAMIEYLTFLLQMICLQRPAIASMGHHGSSIKQIQLEQVHLLVRLVTIAVHPSLTSGIDTAAAKEDRQQLEDVQEFALDVTATLVDEVSEDVRLMCARMLRDRLHDSRVRCLFGSVNAMGSDQAPDLGQGLLMAKDGKGVVGEWKPRVWEVLDNGGGKESELSLGLGLFGARHEYATA